MKRRNLWSILLMTVLSVVVLLAIRPDASAASINASGYCGGEGDGTNLTWTLDSEGTLTISGTGKMKDFGLNKAPWKQHSPTKLMIKLGVTSIGRHAFDQMKTLSGDLTIPNSVGSIGDLAFVNCNGFTGSLVIPNSVTEIGEGAFANCTGFTGNLIIPNSVTKIATMAFNGCSGFSGDLIISDSVTKIESSAFCGCSGFSGKLIIPNSVTEIEGSAFANCSRFSGNLRIPDSVTEIGNYAFYKCKGFDGSLVISNSAKRIGTFSFHGCSGLTGSLVIPNSVEEICDYAFEDCNGFTGNLAIGNNVARIGFRTFYNCKSLTGDLIIPDSVQVIADSAFAYCCGFNGELTIGNRVQIIGDGAFFNCKQLCGTVFIPRSVNTIGIDAFSFLYNIEAFKVHAFNPIFAEKEGMLYSKNYTKLIQCPAGKKNSVTISDGVKIIGECAFRGCFNDPDTIHPEIVLPSSLLTIEDYAFEDSGFCGFLIIPDSVTTIGESAFQGCKYLERTVHIGKNVSSIKNGAFYFWGRFYSNLYVFFLGNGPMLNVTAEIYRSPVFPEGSVCHHLSSTTGWTDSEAYDPAAGTWNGYPLKVWEGQTLICPVETSVEKDQYGIFVRNSSGEAVVGAAVTYDSQTSLTDKNGLALFQKFTVGQPLITVSCDGYEPYTNENTNYEKSELGYDIVKLYTPEESAYHLASAYYQNVTGASPNGNKTDVLSGTKRISLGVVLPGNSQSSVNTQFQIDCAVSKDKKDTVSAYQLWQGNKQIAQSSNGTFERLKTSAFSEDGDVFVRVVPKSGAAVDTPINLIFVKETTVKQSGLKLDFDKVTLSVADNIPFLGGSRLNISIPPLPVDIFVSEDTVHVGVNVKLNPDSEDETAHLKKIAEVRELVSQYRFMAEHPNYDWGNSPKERLRSLMSEKKLKSSVGFDMDWFIIGYGEAKIDENGLASVKVSICLEVEGSMKIQGPTVIVVSVPVTYSVKGSVKATLGADGSYDLVNQTLAGDVTLKIEPKLNVFGGIGFGKVTGAGAYGEAKLTGEIQLAGTTNSRGLNYLDLTGELGLKAYLGPFEYTKAVAYQTWHLYTRTKSTRMAARSMTDEIALYEMYDQDTYTASDLSYLTEESGWLGGSGASAISTTGTSGSINTLTALQTNTYRNMQPVLGYADDLPVMVWVRADQTRGEFDYPQLVYSVCNGGVWSQPQPVWPENTTADAAPAVSTAPDGTLWLAWQSSARQMTAEDTISDYVANQTVVVAKFDLDTGSFTDFRTVSESGVFSKTPKICAETGDVFVAWIANLDSGDYFGQNHTNRVCYAGKNDGWTVNTAADALGTVTELTMGLYQQKPALAYVVDSDADLSTTDDSTLYLSSEFGTPVAMASGTVCAPVLATLPGKTAQTLLYTDGEALRDACTAEIVLENGSLENGFAVTSNRIIYAAADSDGGCAQLYSQTYDGRQWLDTVQLTNQNQYLQSYSVLELGDLIYLAAVQADVVITKDAVDDACTLSWAILGGVTDLALIGVDADPALELPGQAVPVTVAVQNCGDTAINGFRVTLRANGKNVAQQDFSQTIAAKKQAEVTIDVTLGAEVVATEYTVVISASGDSRSDNNTGTLSMGFCDLALSTQLIQLGSSRTLLVKVTNQGAVTSDGSLTVDCGKTKKLADIPSLVYGESAFYLIPLTNQDLGSFDGMVDIRLQATQRDWDNYNDTDAQYVSIPYEQSMTITAVSGQQVTVQLQNRNAGTLYVAAYKANGQLAAVASKPVIADAGSCAVTLPGASLPSNCTLKAFLLDENHKPLMPVAVWPEK